MGLNKTAVNSGVIRESVLKPIVPWLIGGLVFLILLHFALCGPCRQPEKNSPAEQSLVCRFRWHERFLHCLLTASFIILGATGFFFLLGGNDPSGPLTRELHAWTGWVFMLSALSAFFIWIRPMFFRKGDAVWLRCFGGYFRKKTGLPAGKFNAGQKIFFWLVSGLGVVLSGTGAAMFFLKKSGTASLSLLYTVHDFAAVCFLLLLFVHIYFGLVINPETMRSIFGGFVRRAWLEEHHPNA